MEAADLNAVPQPEEPKRMRRRVMRAIAARKVLEAGRPPRGRAWINGCEVGGPEPRFAHLSRSHD